MQDKVKEFHKKHEFPIGTPLTGFLISNVIIEEIAMFLLRTAKEIEDTAIQQEQVGDIRLYRTHLLIEELGEALMGLAKCDEIELYDGLLDLLYVVIGTGVTYDFPMQEGFNEVHISNMSKPKREKFDERIRKKEGTYFPPDLERILQLHVRKEKEDA